MPTPWWRVTQVLPPQVALVKSDKTGCPWPGSGVCFFWDKLEYKTMGHESQEALKLAEMHRNRKGSESKMEAVVYM